MRLTYDHTRLAAKLGMATQAVAINLPTLLFVVFHRDFGASTAALGTLVALTFTVQMAVDAIGARFVDRIGYRAAAVASELLSAAGLLLLVALPPLFPKRPFPAAAAALLVAAFGSGLQEVIVSPVVEALPSDRKAADMASLHAAYCWGVVATVLLSTAWFALFGLATWRLLALAWTVLPLAGAALFARVPMRALLPEGESGDSPFALARTPAFLLFFAMMVCGGAAEQAMAQWASLFAQLGAGAAKSVGDLAGPLAFAVLMGSARSFFGSRGATLDVRRAIRLSCALGVAGYLLAAFGRVPALCLAGCALCGLGAGVLWPGTLSLASKAFPRGGTALFGLLALGGDVGCALGPAVVGWSSNAAARLFAASGSASRGASVLLGSGDPLACGLKAAFAFAALFPLAMLVLLFLRSGKSTGRDSSSIPGTRV